MHAEHENRRVRQLFKNSTRSIKAVCLGQSAVHDDDPRQQNLRQADCLISVTGFADYFDVGLVFQHAPKTTPY
jgi:hypothetical protein